jgi:hypothetical protein
MLGATNNWKESFDSSFRVETWRCNRRYLPPVWCPSAKLHGVTIYKYPSVRMEFFQVPKPTLDLILLFTQGLLKNSLYIYGKKHTNIRISLRIVTQNSLLKKSTDNCQCRPSTQNLLQINSEINIRKCEQNLPVMLLCDFFLKKVHKRVSIDTSSTHVARKLHNHHGLKWIARTSKHMLLCSWRFCASLTTVTYVNTFPAWSRTHHKGQGSFELNRRDGSSSGWGFQNNAPFDTT